MAEVCVVLSLLSLTLTLTSCPVSDDSGLMVSHGRDLCGVITVNPNPNPNVVCVALSLDTEQ